MQEYDRSVVAVLQVTRQGELLERSPMLARSIKLRNPYVDALHVAQLALLRRFRALPADAPEDERHLLMDAIHHSINGIAAGLTDHGLSSAHLTPAPFLPRRGGEDARLALLEVFGAEEVFCAQAAEVGEVGSALVMRGLNSAVTRLASRASS